MKQRKALAGAIISAIRKKLKEIDFSKVTQEASIEIKQFHLYGKYQAELFSAHILDSGEYYFYFLFSNKSFSTEVDAKFSTKETEKISQVFKEEIIKKLREMMHEQWQELWNVPAK